MSLLLDTHVWLWWLGAEGRLSDAALAAIADQHSEIFVSAASAWEVSIKRALGKLEAPDDLVFEIAADGFAPLPIELEHAVAAGALPPHHDDPFDRMLVAQARLEQLTIVTSDARISHYEVSVLPASDVA